MSGELIPGCYESKLLRLEDKLQKAQTELQEARRLLEEKEAEFQEYRQHLTDVELQAILERCKAATEGPWKHWVNSGDVEAIRASVSEKPVLICRGIWPNDGSFVTNARTDLPAVVHELIEARRLLKRIADWDFDIAGDCVADAQNMARAFLGVDDAE